MKVPAHPRCSAGLWHCRNELVGILLAVGVAHLKLSPLSSAVVVAFEMTEISVLEHEYEPVPGSGEGFFLNIFWNIVLSTTIHCV